MDKFIFVPFENKNTFLENFSVFIFIELKINGKEFLILTLEDYQSAEFWDDTIFEFHNWLDSEDSSIKDYESKVCENEIQYETFRNAFGSVIKPKVILWRDRDKSDYFKKQLQGSFEFENFIAEKIKTEYNIDIEPFLTPEGQYELGENALGIEIKNDKLISKYGNIYIEVAEKSNPKFENYTKSGILKKDNTKFFLIGDYDQYFIISKKRLLEIYREELPLFKEKKNSKRGIKFKIIPTSMGFVIPVKSIPDDFISFKKMMELILNETKNE